MLRLETIKESYGFKEVTWEVDGKILKTEKGLKRLSHWTEKDNMEWHINWRDRLAEKTGCLTDRMIQSLYGERKFLSDVGWYTLHDEVTSPFSYQNREKEMGIFFGHYFSTKIEDDHQNLHIDVMNLERMSDQISKPSTAKNNHSTSFIEGLRRESINRLLKAKRLWKEGQQAGGEPPIVTPIDSLDQGKNVFEKLFWQHGTGRPEKGYRSLKIVLSQWLQRYGRNSLYKLLNELDKQLSLRELHAKALLAECLTPREFIQFMNEMKDVKDQQQIEKCKENLSYQWEESLKLVKALSEWLDLTREKVPNP
ncbi:hypothetical protein [Evansella tamaricis]|uniref:Uncharacterized protein n=1 Tax=Evansella tamaricis TaxID=2069301 RepID=A0ABS6JBD2_9BACI|nr:hypothetical protein [Evansella tamaricis]MBU9710987.1 hypothetical protein [Evansella tamaricis]